MKHLTWLLLVGVAMGQAKPAEKLPEIPIEYRDKLKTLVIKQESIQLEQLQLQTKFNADQRTLSQINSEGQTLETEVLKKLGLDIKKYAVAFKDNDMRVTLRDIK